jgi:hypothetical protein
MCWEIVIENINAQIQWQSHSKNAHGYLKQTWDTISREYLGQSDEIGSCHRGAYVLRCFRDH